MDMLCLMHQGVPYGHLADKAGPLAMGFIASRCGITTRQLTQAVAELETHAVFDRNEKRTIFSRRMVKDEHNRIARGNGGIKSLVNSAVPRPKDTSKDTLPCSIPNDHKGPTQEDVVVSGNGFHKKETSLRAIPKPSQAFEKWWSCWSAVRGTHHRQQAETAYVLYVTVDLEQACIDCTRSYLASLSNPASGFNPHNFLMNESSDDFRARWPASRKRTSGDELETILEDL